VTKLGNSQTKDARQISAARALCAANLHAYLFLRGNLRARKISTQKTMYLRLIEFFSVRLKESARNLTLLSFKVELISKLTKDCYLFVSKRLEKYVFSDKISSI